MNDRNSAHLTKKNLEPAVSDYAFVKSGRWAGLIVVAALASVVCVLLGLWQWGRYEEKAARLQAVNANYFAAPTTLDDLLREGLVVSGTSEWRRVRLRGNFLPGSAITLRNRPVAGAPALHLLGIFLSNTAKGPVAVLIDLGWVPAESEIPPLPAGTQELEVRVRPHEPSARSGAGWVSSLNPSDVARQSGLTDSLASYPALQGYGLASSPTAPLRSFPEPEQTLGSNLSYAFQWWLFAAGLPLGLWLLARREARDTHALLAAGARRGSLAEQEEDALIDAQLAQRLGQ